MSLPLQRPAKDIHQAQRDLAFAEHRLGELKAQIGVMNRAGEPVPERMKREEIALQREIRNLCDCLEG